MKIIAIDFDGTVTDHRYPSIGPDLPHAERVIRRIASKNKIILYTMRSEQYLEEACKWYYTKNIPIYGANVNPDQHLWSKSPKVYAHMYIDDAALGAPLIQEAWMWRPGIDWLTVESMLASQSII